MLAQFIDVCTTAGDFNAVHCDCALVGIFQRVDATQHRGLAGTRGPQNHHLFAAVHIKVDALENFQVSEVLVQPADADHDVFVAHLSSPLPRRFSSMWISQAKPSVATQYITEIVR